MKADGFSNTREGWIGPSSKDVMPIEFVIEGVRQKALTTPIVEIIQKSSFFEMRFEIEWIASRTLKSNSFKDSSSQCFLLYK